ncbi:MAG: metal-sulfur cluster assembly factor [Candidatus Nanoarchaeia archaeon]|nr:metal-sulfur cluster assembly factor [Candidatus Nanoarchaeia archaeon]
MITKEQTIEIMKTCEDPELGIDIWTLGLVYNIEIKEETIKVTMTFTTPTCPYGPLMLEELKSKLEQLGFKEAEIEITFNPPWQPSEEVKEMLGVA